MVEATRTDIQEREALIQETLRQEGRAVLPTDSIVSRGEEGLPLEDPVTIREVTAAGYKWVWDTKTFEKVPVLWYMLPAKLRQRNDDGSYRFTPIDPKKMPYRGILKCRLHKDDPDRKHFDELGFRYCTKENLTNPYERDRHMKMKHPKEWETIDAARKERERLEDRELQKSILSKVGQPIAPLYVSDKKPRGRPKK